MEIVIKIDEKDYQSLKDGHIPFNVLDVIMNGTPLPKGHGDLIDKKEVYKKFYCRCLARVAKEVLEEIPTIIEADRSEGE